MNFWERQKVNRNLVAVLLTILILATGFLPACRSSLEPGVTGSCVDTNLEAAVRKAIEKPRGDISATDRQRLTRLDASGRNIVDLSGLEDFTNLETIYLGRNRISDISPLASLTNLHLLGLEENQISDLSPLASL